MSLKFLHLSAAALALAVAGPAMALDIKGLEIGKPLDCERMKAEGTVYMSCDDVILDWNTTLLGKRADFRIKLDPQTRGVVNARILSDFDFADVRQALTQKFGAPVCSEVPMTNGFGAKFARTICHWDDATAVLYLTENAGKLGERSLILASQAAMKAQARERAKAASDL